MSAPPTAERVSAPPPAMPQIVPRFGLWARMALLLLVAIPGAAALPAWTAYRDTRELARNALTARARAVTRSAASSAQYCISGGETECARLVRVLLTLDDVAWAAVVDEQGLVPAGAAGHSKLLVLSTPAATGSKRGLAVPGDAQATLDKLRFHGDIPGSLTHRDVWHRGVHYLAVIVPLERPATTDALDVFLGAAPAATGPVRDGAIEVGFSLESRDRAIAGALRRNLTVAGIVTLLALLLAFVVTGLLTTPLLRIARVSEAIARGDLRGRVEVRSLDEIGLLSAAFNRILASLRGALGRISDGSDRIDRAAAELVQLMSEQRAGAGENLATVSATTTAISGIVASGAEMRQRGLAAIDLAARAISSSEQVSVASHRALEEALRELDRIRTHVTQIAARVEELEARAQPLGRIVETTAELADRLHDLSLGASQEAVVLDRAPGTNGRAVIASIVADLRAQSREAQRASSGARRTLAEVQHAIRRARSAAEEGARAVETSSARTRAAETNLEQRGTAMRDISRALRQLSDLIQEQLERIEQIFEGVENVRRATSHFSHAADQTLGTARGLSRLSSEMKEILSGFRLR